MEEQQLIYFLSASWESFKDSDEELLTLDLHERTITAALMHHMVGKIEGYNVDCEYNKKGSETKKMAKEGKTRIIYPDIVVHKRGEDTSLIAIEVKKSVADANGDIWKLEGFTSPDFGFCYEYAVGLVINCKRRNIVRADVFVNGARCERISQTLLEALG